MAKSVVLLSGGLDSSANLAFCQARDEAVLALTVDYGQRAAARELEAGRALARHFGVRHEAIDLRWLGQLGGSSLTDSARDMPSFKRSELDDAAITRSSARSVWVPNRNGVLINAAAAFADRLGAERVVVGFNREEAATFADNSADYLALLTAAFALSTSNGVRVHCYTTEMMKSEIVAQLVRDVPTFPFELLWSCYEGSSATACGRCESCQRLSRALEQGGAQR